MHVTVAKNAALIGAKNAALIGAKSIGVTVDVHSGAAAAAAANLQMMMTS